MRRGGLAGLLWVVLSAGSGWAADRPEAPYSLYFELFGNGGIYSVNADYRLSEDFSARLGFVSWSASGFFGDRERLTAFPILVNYLYGRGNHWLETGLGVLTGHFKKRNAFGDTIENYTFTTLTGSIAYRYQRPAGGYFFKAGLTPMYSWAGEEKSYPDDGFLPWFGVAWGVSF